MTTAEHRERREGYERFFGLNETPFSLAPNPRFLFASDSHAAALAQVAYALERREPLVVITGEIGTGKTLLCRTVPQRLERKTFVSVINDPLLERDDLLRQLLRDFGVISKDPTRLTQASRHELIHTLQAFLASLVPIQAHAVVIIDEAQHLQPDVLEQIRLLSNIDDERGTLLQIILVGQTDLEPLLSRPELRQFQQRVSRRFQLKPLNANEVQQYIEHRLALARGTAPPSQTAAVREPEPATGTREESKPGVEFTPDAIQAVSKLSGGLPRVINLVCDRSLETAYVFRLRTIDSPVINTAARALGIAEDSVPAGPPQNAPAPETTAEPYSAPWTFATLDKQAELDAALRTPLTAFEPAASDEFLQPASEAVPDSSTAFAQRATTTRLRAPLVLATALAAAAVIIWLGVRAANPPTTPTRPEAAAPAPPASAAPTTQSDPVPAGALSPPEREAATGTPPAVGTTAPAPSPAAAAAATVEHFEIVVASFRAEAGATSAAADVAALGLPTRRRVLDGWQQVLSGPCASRAQAADAQQRLERAGLTGTQIVPTAR
jgi:type II secretory pathway predicted ATPase ExeA/cell division protein FtsN